jgi:hypothetical protein
VPQADSPKAPRAEPAAKPRKVRRLVRGVVIDPPGEIEREVLAKGSKSFEVFSKDLVQDRKRLAALSRVGMHRFLAYI